MKYILGLKMLLLVTIGSVNIVMAEDTPLNQAQRDFIESAYPKTIPPHNEGFDLLVGMFAEANKDPKAEGARWIQKVRDHYQSVYIDKVNIKSAVEAEAKIYKDLDTSLKIDLIDEVWRLCKSDCTKVLLSIPESQRKELLKKYELLLQRYQNFIKTDNYVNVQPYILDAQFPYYYATNRLHLLYLLNTIDQVAALKASNATLPVIKNVLETLISTHRKRFLDQETLLGEMLLNVSFNQTLEIAYQLAYASLISLDITPLSPIEINLCPAFQREAFMKYHIDFGFDVSDLVEMNYVEKYADIFLVEETRALLIDDYSAFCQLSRTSLLEYDVDKSTMEERREQRLQSIKEPDLETLSVNLQQSIAKNEAPDKWRNICGKMFYKTVFPMAFHYIERSQSINSKIALINLLLKERPDTITQAWLDQQKIRFNPTLNSTNDQICLKVDGMVQQQSCTAVRPYQ